MKVINTLINGFYFAQLEICHCEQILTLQQVVLDALPEDQKAYLIEKSAEQIRANTSEPNYAIGVFDKHNQLLGTAFLLAYAPDLPLNGLTQCDALDSLLKDVGKAGVIATVMVHPAVKSCFCWKSGGGKRGFGLVMFALCAWQNRFSDADEVQQAA